MHMGFSEIIVMQLAFEQKQAMIYTSLPKTSTICPIKPGNLNWKVWLALAHFNTCRYSINTVFTFESYHLIQT